MRPARPATSRPIASLALAGLCALAPTAASGQAAASDPFPPLSDATARASASAVTPESVGGPSYTRAYVAFGAGAALMLGSFLLAESADRAYERYLGETDPGAIEDAYDEAARLDDLSAATLIAGNAALVLGLYWRFVQHPKSTQDLRGAGRDAPDPAPHGLEAWLAPDIGPGRVGLAVTVALP